MNACTKTSPSTSPRPARPAKKSADKCAGVDVHHIELRSALVGVHHVEAVDVARGPPGKPPLADERRFTKRARHAVKEQVAAGFAFELMGKNVNFMPLR